MDFDRILDMPQYDYSNLVRHMTEIKEEDTLFYQIQQQTNQIIEKNNEQIALLVEQNKQLQNNYKKLEALYEIKEKELAEVKKESKKSKRHNAIAHVIAIISMLVAVAAWLLPDILK